MNNYPTLSNDFTRKEESDKIKFNNSYPALSNQMPKLSSEQQKISMTEPIWDVYILALIY